MFKEACLCVVAFLIIAEMFSRIPMEVAKIRALDIEIKLHTLCDGGDYTSCSMIVTEDHNLNKKASKAIDNNLQGVCLYVGGEGIALKSQAGGVSDISMRARSLLE